MAFQVSYEYLFELIDKISPEVQKMSKQMDKMEKGFTQGQKRMRDAAQKTNEQLASMRSSVKNLVGAYLGFETAKRIINTITSFDDAIVSMKASIDGISQKDIDKLKKLAIAVGIEYGKDPAQVARGFVSMAKGGMQTIDILKQASNVMKIATAGEVDFDFAADQLLGTMTSLGKSSDFIPELGDKMIAAADASVGGFRDVAIAVSKIAPSILQFNLPLNDTIAAVTQLTDAFGTGELGGSGYRMMVSSMFNETKKGTEVLKKHGLTYDDINLRTNDLVDVLKKVAPILESGSDSIALFGEQGVRAASTLAKTYDKFVNQYKKGIDESVDSVDRKAKLLKEKLNVTIGTTGVLLKGLTLQIGEDGLTGEIEKAFKSLNKFLKYLEENPAILNFAFKVIKLVAGIWLLRKAMLAIKGLWNLGKWVKGLKSVKKGYSGIKKVALFTKDVMLRMVGITKEMEAAIIGKLVSAWNKVSNAIVIANAKMQTFNKTTLANPVIRTASVLMGVWDTMTDTDKVMANLDKARNERDIGKGSLQQYDLSSNSPTKLLPLQQLMQSKNTTNTTTQNSRLGIDLNVNGVPKGSEVKTNAKNIPNGMSIATNYNLGLI